MAWDIDDRDLNQAHDARVVADAPGASGLAESLLSAIPDCVKLLDREGRLSSMSHAGLCLMEIENFPSLKGQPWWSLWPPEAESTIRRSVESASRGEQTRFTAFCPTAKGTPKWWDVSVTPMRNTNGEISGIVSVSRDVTGHVEAREETEARRIEAEVALERTRLLLREIDHRVKNSLMLIVGLLQLQVRQARDSAAAEALSEAARRVRTVARVHDRLYRAETPDRVALDDYLQNLCADLGSSFQDEGQGRIESDLAMLWVAPDRAVALGLITAELVANAYRHAGLGPEGWVKVTLAPDGEGRARLVVADSGTGLPADFCPENASGIGMRVVLGKAEELEGDLAWTAGPQGGTEFTLTFSIGQEPAASGALAG